MPLTWCFKWSWITVYKLIYTKILMFFCFISMLRSDSPFFFSVSTTSKDIWERLEDTHFKWDNTAKIIKLTQVMKMQSQQKKKKKKQTDVLQPPSIPFSEWNLSECNNNFGIYIYIYIMFYYLCLIIVVTNLVYKIYWQMYLQLRNKCLFQK